MEARDQTRLPRGPIEGVLNGTPRTGVSRVAWTRLGVTGVERTVHTPQVFRDEVVLDPTAGGDEVLTPHFPAHAMTSLRQKTLDERQVWGVKINRDKLSLSFLRDPREDIEQTTRHPSDSREGKS